MRLEGVKQTLLEKRKLCATKYAAFDQFELMNLSFNGTIAVDLCESGDNRLFVTENTRSESV